MLRTMLVLGLAGLAAAAKGDVYQKIKEDSDLSEFLTKINKNRIAGVTLEASSCTVFAPSNIAFQRSDPKEDTHLALYHILNTAQKELPRSVFTMLDGNPPLWITKVGEKNREVVYVNNAKVLQHKSKVLSVPQEYGRNLTQILHVMDEVLEPVWPLPSGSDFHPNPNALQFILMARQLPNIMGEFTISKFQKRIIEEKKQNVFENEGHHTFFVPVDQGFNPDPHDSKIDAKVIDGHVIPDNVLFTRPTPDEKPFETLAFTDMLKVTISFGSEGDRDVKRYVKSNTITEDQDHPKGVVLAEIVKANIPVKNGVVHLIKSPLMVVDSTISQFLERFKNISGVAKEDGCLYRFVSEIKDRAGSKFLEELNALPEVTLFAPNNRAWDDPNLSNILQDSKKIVDILKMHVVKEKLSLDKIHNSNTKQVSTLVPRKHLYFNVVSHGAGNQTLTVEGGGVNATVVEPNIAATNGIIHIIDRVLGVPFTTILMKLASDPMLRDTYTLGHAEGFNNQLNDTKKRFTYFVPRDHAWGKIKNKLPSEHKKLFMPKYAYHARSILEKHLVVTDQVYTMAHLKEMTKNGPIVMPTVRGELKIQVTDDNNSPNGTKHHSGSSAGLVSGYTVHWDNSKIQVVRADVECTNGVIHVIDGVFLREGDIVVNGAPNTVSPVQVTIGFLLALIFSHLL